MEQLKFLKKITNLSIDTGNINYIKYYMIDHVTTNPSIIFETINYFSSKNILDNAILYARKKSIFLTQRINYAINKFLVNLINKILNIISGTISIGIDARFCFNIDLCIKKAQELISMCKEYDIDKSRVLIKIISTWEGIKAAEELQKMGINCNLTLILSLTQARACAEAGVYLISPFIGRINDWYNKNKYYNNNHDYGVRLVKKISNFYKKYSYKTAIMGASLRTLDQIVSLVECDYLTISPNILSKLNNISFIKNYIINKHNYNIKNRLSYMSEKEFKIKCNKNLVIMNKLYEGINKFILDQINIECFLASKLY
ncbi:MAG: transaldolase [Candidatus Lightella neohaematopini]|nr:transaldolase [Candidatus Lightella neohaematopini]MCV2528688.1 transaldolase [Candidatus Lightella neohaematopini]